MSFVCGGDTLITSGSDTVIIIERPPVGKGKKQPTKIGKVATAAFTAAPAPPPRLSLPIAPTVSVASVPSPESDHEDDSPVNIQQVKLAFKALRDDLYKKELANTANAARDAAIEDIQPALHMLAGHDVLLNSATYHFTSSQVNTLTITKTTTHTFQFEIDDSENVLPVLLQQILPVDLEKLLIEKIDPHHDVKALMAELVDKVVRDFTFSQLKPFAPPTLTAASATQIAPLHKKQSSTSSELACDSPLTAAEIRQAAHALSTLHISAPVATAIAAPIGMRQIAGKTMRIFNASYRFTALDNNTLSLCVERVIKHSDELSMTEDEENRRLFLTYLKAILPDTGEKLVLQKTTQPVIAQPLCAATTVSYDTKTNE